MTPFEKLLTEMPMDDDSTNMIKTATELYSMEMRAVWLRGYVEGVLAVDPSNSHPPAWLHEAMLLLKLHQTPGGTA